MILLSITGLFKMALIIMGVIFLLRLIGKVMIARRNVNEQFQLKKKEREKEEMLAESQKNFGKTTISKIGKDKFKNQDYVDFEEIKDE
jgi:hypothetical protein